GNFDPRNFGVGWTVVIVLERRLMERFMGRLAAFLCVIVLPVLPAPPILAEASTRAGDTYYPLGKGYKWIYNTDYSDDTELIHEVTASEKVGDTECFVVEHKTVSPATGTGLMRKEWLAAAADG